MRKSRATEEWRQYYRNRRLHMVAENDQYHYRERVAYHGAKARCTNPNESQYKDWGGRGIEFRFTSFEQFFACIGPRPSPAYSLDRIDNDGHYEPGNVRWATRKEQIASQRKPRNPVAIAISTLRKRGYAVTQLDKWGLDLA